MDNHTLTLTGTVQRITKRGDNLVVFYLKDKESEREFKAIANDIRINEKDELTLHGTFKHSKHGTTFSVTKVDIHTDTKTKERKIIKAINTLTSIKGIGIKTAENIIEKLGENAIELIKKNSSCLEKVKGLKIKHELIADSLNKMEKNSTDTKIIRFLQDTLKLNEQEAQRILYYRFKNTTESLEDFKEILFKNPYILTDIIPFKIVDKIARDVYGIDENTRLRAVCLEALRLLTIAEGSSIANKDTVVSKTLELLKEIDDNNNTTKQEVISALEYLIDKKEIINPIKPSGVRGASLFLKSVYFAEISIAKRLKQIIKELKPPSNLKVLIKEYENRRAIKLDPEQNKAIQRFWENSLSIVDGQPGTGKTEVIDAIIKTVKAIKPNDKILLLAPTANAAKLLSKRTGLDAFTIHRALSIYGEKGSSIYHHEANPLPYDLVVIDEAGMMDTLLFNSVLMTIKAGTKIVLLGDQNQLPSIGAGAVLRDLIETLPHLHTRLKTIHRNKSESSIPYICRDILNGKLPDFEYDDAQFIEESDSSKIKNIIIDIIKDLQHKGYNPHDIQVLSPRKSEVGLSAEDLNILLQDYYNHQHASHFYFWEHDKVVQTTNRYDLGIINGDQGIISKIENEEIHIAFEEENVSYPLWIAKDFIELGYCLTVHKSQGCQYPVVIIPVVSTFGSRMLYNELFYTALSRPIEKLYIVGEKDILEKAIGKYKSKTRITSLKKRIEAHVCA